MAEEEKKEEIKRDQSPQRKKKKGCRCNDEDYHELSRCDKCKKDVCRWCRMDGYDRNLGHILTSCKDCLYIAAEGVPTAWRRPDHCGKGYYEAYEKDEMKKFEEESEKYAFDDEP